MTPSDAALYTNKAGSGTYPIVQQQESLCSSAAKHGLWRVMGDCHAINLMRKGVIDRRGWIGKGERERDGGRETYVGA